MTWSSFRNAVAACLIVSVAALDASAAVSKKYQEWREGPVQWIMTPEEKRAWRDVKSDEDAVTFIDLFWARRDPSLQTETNEFRLDFEARVEFADRTFPEKRRRGAMTDRGRVLIVLGPPSKSSSEFAYTTHTAVIPNASGSRQMGGRDEWVYDYALAQKFDMPKINVLFVERTNGSGMYRDPLRADFSGAEPTAVRRTIASPDMTEVPDWAMRGGLEPKVFVLPGTAPAASGTAEGRARQTPAAPADPAIVERVVILGGERGASRLTLARDVFSVETETKSDPFKSITPVTAFTSDDELGWATQYCTEADDAPLLKFSLRLTGTSGNEVIDRAAPVDELIPDRMKAVYGCYMLRGSIPLADMTPGDYELEVTIHEPDGTNQALKQPFRIDAP